MTETQIKTEENEKIILNLGPSHPAMHGILQNIVEIDGERIVSNIPTVGYVHRGFEKIAERMSYQQILVLTDRLNYVSSAMNNIGWTVAIEQMMEIEVPKKVDYVRVIVSELSRIIDHAVCLGILGVDLGALTGFLYLYIEREKVYNILEKLTGARQTTAFGRIGGLTKDIYPDFISDVKEFVETFPKTWNDFDALLSRNRIFIDRTRGVGGIDGDRAWEYGFTGPNLRAAGIDWDIRKQFPYCSYDEFEFDIPTGTDGDVYDRYLVRMEEMRQSLKIIEQALEKLNPDDPWHADVPKIILPEREKVYNDIESLIHHFKLISHGIKVPKGEFYHSTEVANGELGFYIVSDGGMNPYRMHIRRPCFWFYQAVEEILPGCMLADAVATLSSINVIAGELDG